MTRHQKREAGEERSEASYHELVTAFPPRVIRSQAACERTKREICRLDSLDRVLTKDEEEYLSVLRVLVESYEGPPGKPRALALLEQLLAEHQLRKTDLSRILGKSLSLCSMILNGQRSITREHAKRLGHYFGKGPELFLA